MPRIGVSITKSCAFRGATQEFSNVYYFEMATLPGQSAAATLADNLVTAEKTFHSTLVTFVRARVWSQTGSASTNEMIDQHNLSGTGSRTTVSGMDRERAFLFRLRAGVDSRGNPVYLRKWYHSCGNFVTTVTIGTSQLDNSAGFTTTERGNLVGAMNSIGDANGSAGAPKLCAKGGRQSDAGATWTAHQFLEHHQLGDQWRAQ
jgi:hypothetical protein